MDNSRRPFNRSREPGPKKPRLAADKPNSRPFSRRLMGSGPNQVQSRYDRDKDDTDLSHGGGYQPQPVPQHQQHLDLVEQYRTALSELTFNSKPIITNLTIIAGENLHAAKSIASTICANILEVPSDQKLPSLYLLDSIVKNIGRDYIKYFAYGLPEVFCTTYRQVDPPINASMFHLFGTWKGVFHPQVLQIIEKELGFGSSANGSSAPATSRSESQSQRPAHSIHVNPKYLERRHLQQSARPKVIANDIDSALVNSSEDIERLDRPTAVTTGRTWAGPPAKMRRSQRDPRFNPLHDKNSTGVVYGDSEYGSEISRNSGLGPGRSVVKVTEQKPRYGVSSGAVGVADAVSTRRNGYPTKHKLQSYPPPNSSNIDSQLRSGSGMSSSWKNSEEEEFSWDSMDSRSTDHDATINMSSITKKDHWTTDGSEKLDFENNLQKTLSREGRNRIGTSSLSGVPYDYLATVSGPTTRGCSLSRTGMGPEIRSSSYIGNPSIGISGASSWTIGQQQLQSPGPISPSAQSPMRHHSPVNITRHTQTDLKTSQFSGKLSLGLNNQYDDGSENSLPLSLETSEHLNAGTSSLLDAIAKSGSIPVNTVFSSLPDLGSQDKGFAASQASSMALPGGPLSTQLPIPRLNLESSTVLATSKATPAATDATQGKTTKTEPEESRNVTKNSDPISSLLTTLIAKGLISTSKKEPLAPVPSQTAKPLLNVKQEAITATTEPVSSASVSAKISISVAVNGVSTPEPIAESSELPRSPPVTEDIKNLIGFEFKPEVLRKFHSSVIDDLFDRFPYQCGICGLRLDLKERLDRHLDWHASQNPVQRDAGNASNKWYLHSNDWVARRNGLPLYGVESIKVEEEKGSEMSQIIEPMVPEDESQCACILCGNLFEDFYDLGREEWMFSGAVYMNIPHETPKVGAESDSNFWGLIVHANCLSESSIQDLGLVNGVKMEEDA